METNILQARGEIVLYQPDETIKLEVRLEQESVWLSQAQMAQLFATTKQNISSHISSIFREGELDREVVVKDFFTTTPHGAIPGKTQRSRVVIYNLDVIISVGYRVKSQIGTRFRQWANKVLKDYLLRGYSVNHQLVALQERTDERLSKVEQRLDDQQQKIDFLVKTNTPPKEKLFPNGCVFDAWAYLSELVRKAEGRILLIDNYCDERTLSLLAKRGEGVIARIYTRYSATFVNDLKKWNEQYPNAEVEFRQLPHKEHDRFLIVDEDVYILGDSLKDLGHSLTAILKTSFTPEQILTEM